MISFEVVSRYKLGGSIKLDLVCALSTLPKNLEGACSFGFEFTTHIVGGGCVEQQNFITRIKGIRPDSSISALFPTCSMFILGGNNFTLGRIKYLES